jgi:glycosyltransferase involved in cell wall biosynthesis
MDCGFCNHFDVVSEYRNSSGNWKFLCLKIQTKMELIFIFITGSYLFFIGILFYGFDKVAVVENRNLDPKTTFSVIVPFRNEKAVLLELLESISRLNYSHDFFEIILINDASEDNSVAVIEKWKSVNPTISATILQNKRTSLSPKKDAISTAIEVMKNQWIITTDADCTVPENWLLSFDNFIQNTTFEMLAGAVSVKKTGGFLNFFQFVDLLSLQGTTIGSFGINNPFMCNGANFGYTKKLFLKLNGFEGNENLASGDDVFLLQKAIKSSPKKVAYHKNSDAIVLTKSETSLANLFQQRVRWASKTGSYESNFAKTLAFSVLAINVLLVGLFCFGLWNFFFGIFILKFLFDYVLLYKTNLFFGNTDFFFPVWSSLLYPFFVSCVGIYSFFGTFDWKGKSYRK